MEPKFDDQNQKKTNLVMFESALSQEENISIPVYSCSKTLSFWS
jgi:hypothetical protein